MVLRKRPIAAGIAALVFSGYLSALGLGEIQLKSALNEPLDAEIPLVNLGELGETEILADLASKADFANAGVDRDLLLSGLVFTLDLLNADGPMIRVSSKKAIREPYVDFLVDVQWPAGRVLREYTLLLDLPVYAGGSFTKKKPQPIAGLSAPKVSASASSQTTPATAPKPRSAKAQTAASAPSGRGGQFSSQALPSPDVVAGDDEYLVENGDTLWGIAKRLSGEKSVYERMGAIHQLNPRAFINNNIDLLKRGSILRLPEYGAATSYSGQGIAGDSGNSNSAAPLSGSARESGSPLSSDTNGHLSLSSSSQHRGQGSSALGSGGSGMSPQVSQELSNIQEELDRTRRENGELKVRLTSLEGQIATMQRLFELKDDGLRATQLATQLSQAAENTQEPSNSLAENTSSEPESSPSLALFPSANVKKVESTPVSPSEPVVAAATNGSDAASDTTLTPSTPSPTAANSVDSNAGAAPSPAPSSMKMDLQSNDKGWVEKVSSYLLYILGLVAVVIAAVVFFLRRKNSADDSRNDSSRSSYVSPQVKAQNEEPASSFVDEDIIADEDIYTEPKSQFVARASAPEPVLTPAPEPTPVPVREVPSYTPIVTPIVAPAEPASTAPSLDSLNLDEDFDFLDDIDEGDTQLELAQAYLEMGDQSGAKEILLEVADEGNNEQKAKARQMLDQMG